MTYGYKQINKLAIPAIISGIAEPLLSITDTAIVGNIPINPVESLAAVGIAGSFISALVWILAQTRSAISAIIAEHLGANKLKEVSNLPVQILLINMILSLVLVLGTYFFAESVFRLYNAEGTVLSASVSYYKIRSFGIPLTLIVFTLFGVFRGLQNTYYPMLIAIVGAGVNIGLDFILVYGIDGFIEPMYIEGAAWASVISQGIMVVLSVYWVIKKMKFPWSASLKINPQLGRLLMLSLNLFIRAASLNLALYFANSFATSYGPKVIAAQTIAFQIWLFFSFFIDGYASVANIVSGKLKGAGEFIKMENLIKSLLKISLLVVGFLIFLGFVFYQKVPLLFTKDQAVIAMFSSVFYSVLLMQPLSTIAFVFDGLFKGLAEAVVLRNTLLVATFFGFIPTIYLCDYFGMGLDGVWLAFWVWMLYRAGILIFWFYKRILPKKAYL